MSHPATDTARAIHPVTPGSRKDRTRRERARTVQHLLAAGERAPQLLADNPNRGKRHASRIASLGAYDSTQPALVGMTRPRDGGGTETTIRDANSVGHLPRERAPLTVKTQPAGARRVRDASGRLVPFETAGYTV